MTEEQPCILVADDDAMIRTLMAVTLQKAEAVQGRIAWARRTATLRRR